MAVGIPSPSGNGHRSVTVEPELTRDLRNPFVALGVEPRFDIDLTAVAERHRELSRVMHPDRFAHAGAGERRQALNNAMWVNDAWRRLKDPVLRAEALLQHLGVPANEQGEPKASPALLMEMMEAREQLAALRQEANALPKVVAWREKSQQRLAVVGLELTTLFAAALQAMGKPGFALELNALRQKVGELRYCQRLLEEAANLEDELG